MMAMAMLDKSWHASHHHPPAWDGPEHLAGALGAELH